MLFYHEAEHMNDIQTIQNKIYEVRGQHSKYLPFAFTREGIAMLSGVRCT